ncbi:lysozyme inhibitor LprI family protein [Sporosarcina sp. HYO08]|uniref:lysozyme inhibitor LprI family protein n=1 Tax=Sporosarcina sp. HYO08 TaxID=1759557 RepID=UPI00079BC184|nr:lysozyme inhibitor LprI family protein [Sporosarcina sp. HYO08]KXH87536.1 hypothetical protein AU377_02930 [Sporosarcina sp. HYO08]
MKKLAIVISSVCFLLMGCGNSTFDKAIEQSKLALANGEFEKALSLSELALEEKPKDEEAKALYTVLTAFDEVKDAFNRSDWEETVKKIDALNDQKNLPGVLKKELKAIEKDVRGNIEQQSTVANQIKAIENLIGEKKLDEAKELLDQLQNDETLKEGLAAHSEVIHALSNNIHTNLQKQSEEQVAKAKEEAAVAKETATKAKEEASKAKKSQSANQKYQYLRKLDGIEAGLSDLAYLYANGITAEMKEAEAEVYKRWDDALNEIYGVLKSQLSKNEMDLLRGEQRDWILYRDYEAEKAASAFEGGTFAGVQYLSTLGELTKKRCYQLVELYMK